MKQKDKVTVKVYFNPKTFLEVAELAEKAGYRRRGLQLYTQKKHGFADEKVANTDGISKFLKSLIVYWKKNEAQRMERKADLLKQKKAIDDELETLES